MTDHIYLNFPDRIEAIKSLLQTDDAFVETCVDYEEICTWLAAQQRTTRVSCDECERALELKVELEQEITSVLRQKGF